MPLAAAADQIAIARVRSIGSVKMLRISDSVDGMIVAPAALSNAIADALAPWGARVTEMYLPPEAVLRLAGALGPGSDQVSA